MNTGYTRLTVWSPLILVNIAQQQIAGIAGASKRSAMIWRRPPDGKLVNSKQLYCAGVVDNQTNSGKSREIWLSDAYMHATDNTG